MPHDSKKKDDNLCNVNCSVQNCVFHASDDSCHADYIKVDSKNAMTTNETSCATFEIKR